jgi:hypothetical protein
MVRRRTQHGFALMLILVLVGLAVVLGMTYISEAALKQMSSKALPAVTRARYLAESGIQHAIYVCQTAPRTLAASSASNMLGPYSLDDSGDTYTFYGTPDPLVLGQWTLVGQGASGSVVQRVTAVVFRNGGTDFTGGQSMASCGAITIPTGTKVTGNLLVSGNVTNKGIVDGTISYTGNYTASGGGTTTHTPVKVTSAVTPTLTWSDYEQYTISSLTYNAQKTNNVTLDSSTVSNGTCVGAGNPAGVLWVHNNAFITDNFTFTGTLLAEGNLYIIGRNVHLTAVHGFPAIVSSQKIYIADGATITIDGLVYEEQGVLPYLTDTPNARITINGAFVSKVRGFDTTLRGTHQLTYTASRCVLLNPRDNTNDAGTARVQITTWND